MSKIDTDDFAPPPSRPSMRPEMRAESPAEAAAAASRARAAQRLADLDALNDGTTDEEGVDEFYIDRNAIPDGWDYEWKAKFVVNEERPAYMTSMERAGWEPVPADRHPAFMPAGHAAGAIERKGMILMERPKELTDRAKAKELRKAKGQVQAKEAQLNDAPQGQFERKGGKVSKSYEAIPIPAE